MVCLRGFNITDKTSSALSLMQIYEITDYCAIHITLYIVIVMSNVVVSERAIVDGRINGLMW